MICPLCEADLPADSRFCPSCGGRLTTACGSCGSPLGTTDHFCRRCGTPATGAVLATGDAATGASAAVSATARGLATDRSPVAERRQVSILFADLVGFTPLSERRDPEEMRELLTRYFDGARTVITRYGGTVEKFIGDAVMAVWGAPTAREDDAERAVRAALELVPAVATLGAAVGVPGLGLRAGVVTGTAAITIGAEGQGIAAGDVVNTASRVQSVAPASGVLVDDSTRRLTEAPIAYEDAGLHELKGKAEPVHLWRATRVVAMVGGKWRAGELEAPFVGRDREFRLIKDLFHASVEERRACLVSVTGLAGIGKTRLGWEFEKYIDGLSEVVLWHRGRCLAYGEGVTYWALAEMVRRRADIVEGEATATAQARLRATVERYIDDPEERRWLEPRLAHLLGLEERSTPDRVDLFAAWRLFLERLAERSPTVLVFEEFQWADAGLVDFIEYLLDWSRHHPLVIVTLARPELTERRPTWGSGKRSFHSLYLEPLSPEAMDELLGGLVPGLPIDLRRRIRDRAEGVPLYAVETVRMLLDRGLLRREGNQYAVVGAVGDLAVPESLHSLIAARLDALPAQERALLQDASVLGQSFTRERLAALAGLDDVALVPRLDALVRKEFLSVQTDPRSPERGQYAFLQALVQRVAYETLSRRDRKARHLEAARQLETTWARDADEVVEVVAAHYLEAHRAAPDDPDAREVAESACRMLVRAGQRASGLGAAEDAERYYLQASELTSDAVDRAGLLEQAGQMAQRMGRAEAQWHYEAAIALFQGAGELHPAARVSARLGALKAMSGDHTRGLAQLERAFTVLEKDTPDGDLGHVASELARSYVLLGRADDATVPLELAIEVAEAEGLPELLAESLITKSFVLALRGRRAEPMALQQHALAIAVENDLPGSTLRAHFNLADLLNRSARFQEAAEHAQSAIALARRLGDRDWERRVLANLAFSMYILGRWDEALALSDEILDAEPTAFQDHIIATLSTLIPIHLGRGDLATANRLSAGVEEFADSADPQTRLAALAIQAQLHCAEGRYQAAIAAGERAFELIRDLGSADLVQESFVVAVDAALATGDLDQAAELLRRADALPRINATGYLSAHVLRFRARLSALSGEHAAAEASFAAAERQFAVLGAVFARAVTLLEHAECLVGSAGVGAGALLVEAGGVFDQLGARPWMERLARLLAQASPVERAAAATAGAPVERTG